MKILLSSNVHVQGKGAPILSVFAVCNQVRFKSAYSASETSQKIMHKSSLMIYFLEIEH